MRCIVWLAAVLLACSSGQNSRPHVPSGSGATVPADAAPPVAGGPTERECDDLVAHVVELHLAELRRTVPTDQLPTEAELAQTRADLAADGGCRALGREELACALAATSLTDVEACQATRRSSTSNSSVAPPGITPPAPRSP
ncbi:MAG: hypothetical protein KF773_12610 [Deltaproteobacteria bacterium]|nr:hypothetical protein [Deltaproteobacteria bacterium]MCW5805731.1 hypothetical protein [Deltaproteobacteria bacterium]